MRTALIFVSVFFFGFVAWAAKPQDSSFQLITSDVLSKISDSNARAAVLVRTYRTTSPTVTATRTPRVGPSFTPTPNL